MAQPKYKITKEDYAAAVKYLHNRLLTPHQWLERKRIDRDAGESAETITNAAYQCQTAQELNEWAERYLSGSQWGNLKMAIRNSRRRNRGTLIEVNDDAFELLKRERSYSGKTFSEIIIAVAEVWEYERERSEELVREELQKKRP